MKRLFYFILALVAISCRFDLEEDNFVELSQVPISGVTIDLYDLQDTVFIKNDYLVSYKLEPFNFPHIAIFAVLGNEIIQLPNELKGTISISHINDQINIKGYLPFEFAVFSTSGTGSLADHAEREVRLISIKKTFYFDVTPTKQIDIRAKKENGSVFLSWDKYPEHNLMALQLKIAGSNPKVINLKLDAAEYQDSTFIGATATYSIITKTNVGTPIEGASQKIDNIIPKILSFEDREDGVLLTWTKEPLYKNMKNYDVTIAGFETDHYTTTDVSDTTHIFNINLGFGDAVPATLITSSTEDLVSSKLSVFKGKKVPLFNKAIADPSDHDILYYFISGWLVRDNRGQRDSTFVIAPSSYFHFDQITPTDIYFSDLEHIYEISLSGLTQKTHPNPVVGFFNFPSSVIAIDDKLLVSHPVQARIYVINKNTDEIIQEFTDPSFGESCGKLLTTSDAQFIIGIGGYNFYRFRLGSDGKIQTYKRFVREVPYRIEKWVFNDDGSKIYMFWQSYSLIYRSKYSFPTFDLEETISIPTISGQFQIDEKTKLLGHATGANVYTIIDCETLSVYATQKTSRPVQNLAGRSIFSNQSSFAYSLSINP